MPGDSRTLHLIAAVVVNDKAQHALAYAPLGFLPSLHESKHFAVLCVVAMMLTGVAMEFGQLHVRGRTFDVHDMMANGAGLLVGTLAAVAIRSRIGKGR